VVADERQICYEYILPLVAYLALNGRVRVLEKDGMPVYFILNVDKISKLCITMAWLDAIPAGLIG
jgi:hypothetical protein